MSERSKLVAFIFFIILLYGSKYVFDQNALVLPRILQLMVSVSLPIVGGLITLDFCSLLSPLASLGNSSTSHLIKRISGSPVRNFFVGFVAAAYFNLVRPPLAANVPFLVYAEWVAVVLAVYVMYSMTVFPVEEFDDNSGNPVWKKHVQEITGETGSDFLHIISVMEQFVNDGIKEPLLVSLSLHLQRIGQTEDEILRTLDPLMNFKEKARGQKKRFLIFSSTKNELALRNKKIRENLLVTLLDEIGRLQSK